MLYLYERYLLGRFGGALATSLALFTGLFFLVTGVQLLLQVPNLDVVFLVEGAPVLLPYVLVHALPVASLLAGVAAFSRLADARELLALELAGLSRRQILLPLLFAALCLALVGLMLNNDLAPSGRREVNLLKRRTVTRLLTLLSRSRNHLEYGNVKLHWRGTRGGELQDLLVYRPGRTPGAVQLFHARRGRFYLDPRFGLLKLELEDVAVLSRRGEKDTAATRILGRVGRAGVILDLEGPAGSFPWRLKDRNLSALLALRLRADLPPGVTRAAVDQEIHRRLSLGLLPAFYALLGGLLGFRFVGRRRLWGYVAALALGAGLYYPLLPVGEGLAEAGTLPAWVAMHLGTGALGVALILLARRTGRP